MARSPRTAPAANHGTTTPNAIASSSKIAAPVRKSARRQSVSSTPSAPLTPGPVTPATEPSTPLPIALKPTPRGTIVEAKTHALRSVGGNGDRAAIPFPELYGGREKCGLNEEDEADDVLMAACAACALLNNRALSPDELASISIGQGWIRPPSAAIEPSTVISTAIRAHFKRCEKSTPPREPLFGKHQLAGSVNESVLEPALYPNAFSMGMRPKGTVFYLVTVGKTKWKNPFEGIDIPKPPPRKPAAPKKKREIKPKKETKEKPKVNLKIRLVVNQQNEDQLSDVGTSSKSDSAPRSRSGSAAPSVSRSRSSRRSVLDSSDESDSSESEEEPPIKPRRKNPPAPINVSASPRMTHLANFARHQASPFRDLFFPNSPTATLSSVAPPVSPFPAHSLDNTFWAARGEEDRFASLETSSSSSDEEIRDPEWGNTSGILIRGADGDDQPMWTAEDEEMKVKEATDALRVLFPMSSPEEEKDIKSAFELTTSLDNRPAESESGSIAESAHTLVAQAISRGQLKSLDAVSGSVALNPWTGNSSPVASPSFKSSIPLPDSSPTQHLSKLRSSFDPDAMEIDEEKPWLDESGELPVRAEDSFSDIELGSNVGDSATPEHDRRQHTAEWAREAAASTSFRVKEEPEDYPSPVTTEGDEFHRSRSSSTPSRTPSSRSSDLPPFEFDAEAIRARYIDEIIAGPESISIDEIDGWMANDKRKHEKTPQRRNKPRCQSARCSGNWGGIGVGAMLAISPTLKSTKAPKGIRTTTSSRRRKSSPCVVKFELPHYGTRSHGLVPEVESDAIGPAELEQARAEADAREELRRKQTQEKAEVQKALLEAYRLRVSESTEEVWDPTTPSWIGDTAWGSGSVESVAPSALSPMMLHSVSALSLADLPEESKPIIPVAPEMPAPVAPATLAVPPAGDASPKSIESELTPLPSAAASGSTSPTMPSPNHNVEPAKIDRATEYEIRTNVYASVRGNIPCYSYTKSREGVEDVVILRRLDSDFGKVTPPALLTIVNIEAILISYGVDPSILPKYMRQSSEDGCRRVPPTNAAGVAYTKGVPGFWIPLDVAREIVKAIDPNVIASDEEGLGALLSLDLYQFFQSRTRIGMGIPINRARFGVDFTAGAPLPKTANARAGDVRRPTTKAPAAAGLRSGANSKSTPNLTALGTAPPPKVVSPATPAAQQAKGPLVRSAPATPPDGCPGAKRRRATVVGQSPLKPIPITAAANATPAIATPATRAGTSLPAPKIGVPPRVAPNVARPAAPFRPVAAKPPLAKPPVAPASAPLPPKLIPNAEPAPTPAPKPVEAASTPTPTSAAMRTINSVKRIVAAASAAAHANITAKAAPAKAVATPVAANSPPVRRATRTTDPSPAK